MRVIENIGDMKAVIKSQKAAGKSIGFVPTMGYLHEGHISLVKASTGENDFTVMSIFINPTQFGPNEDFEKYPRDFERDCRMAEDAGVDVVFAPKAKEMYPEGYRTYVDVTGITGVLCGKSRPGHFKGVTTVVTKLFNIVEPDKAYFGQKDAQQLTVIKKMVWDLNMDLEIVTCPIVREADGLAMSSRNVYLNAQERSAALVLSQSLFKAELLVKSGERSTENILKSIEDNIASNKLVNVDYIEAVDADTLDPVESIGKRTLVALAARVGATRLIDNIILEV